MSKGNHSRRLEGMRAVVTGSAMGLGEAIARRFAREGATVLCADINSGANAAVVESIVASEGRAYAMTADVSVGSEVDKVGEESDRVLGGIDVLVNNVGVIPSRETVLNTSIIMNTTVEQRAPRGSGAFSTAGLALLVGCSSLMAEDAFQRVEIDGNPPESPWIKIVGDLDNDKRMDLIIGGRRGPLVYYSNPTWKKSLIAEGGYDSVDGEVGDIDGDGDHDIIMGGVVWYENPLPKSNPSNGSWKVRRIADLRSHDIEVGDLDGDNMIEVVSRDQSGFGHKSGNRISLFKQVAPDKWERHDIDCPHGEGLEFADLDGDGDLDMVAGVQWFENTGRGFDAAWPRHIYAPQWTQEDSKPAVADFNNDGNLDIVLTPAEPKDGRYHVAWYEAPDDPRQAGWKEHIVIAEIETVVHALGAGDFDNDGSTDIALALMHQGTAPQEVAVYLNSESGQNWKKHVLSAKGSHNLVVEDIDGDGLLDVFGANHGGSNSSVNLWKNQLPQSNADPGAGGSSITTGPGTAAPLALDRWQRHVIDNDKPWRSLFIEN